MRRFLVYIYFLLLNIIYLLFFINVNQCESAPDSPRELSINVKSGELVELEWKPSLKEGITGYKVTICPLLEQNKTGIRTIEVGANNSMPIVVSDLTPGASYEVKLHLILLTNTSNTYISANFTTKPNTPGRITEWFRNESTLLVLWQPPYPAAIFDQYKVIITPDDATQSVIYVEKETEPPGPAMTTFYGLTPGRAYNISVQTVSLSQVSNPREVQYRTVPLPPTNVTFDGITSYSFNLYWSPPESMSEFDRYVVSMRYGYRKSSVNIVSKDKSRVVKYLIGLEPGKAYKVIVKALSGRVSSWPVITSLTTRPLPVINLKSRPGKLSDIYLEWKANNESTQDSYMVTYPKLEGSNSDAAVQVVKNTHLHLTSLFPDRNYSIAVVAISNNVYSKSTVVYQSTQPVSAMIGVVKPIFDETVGGKHT